MARSKKSGTLRIRQVKSAIGRLRTHIACARGLGLRKIGQVVEVEDTPSVRGMVEKISYMVEVEEGSAS